MSIETDGISISGTGTFSGTVPQGPPGHMPARGAIRAVVASDGRLRLYPENVLGAIYLHQFGHAGGVKQCWVSVGRTEKSAPHEALAYVELRSDHAPLLSSGGDPFYTGVPLSAKEQKACRALVDEMRGEGEPRESYDIEPIGGGWYRLPDGRKVQGKQNALDAL